MRVERVHHTGGSIIMPALDDNWDDLTKLRWHAAVVEVDSGVHVDIREGGLSRKERRTMRAHRRGWRRILGPKTVTVEEWAPVPGVFSYSTGWCGGGSYTFDGMWTYLNGVSLGAQTVRRETDPALGLF